MCQLLLAYTGFRRGELVVLKWYDVDLDNHTISINKTFAYGKSKRINDILLATPKTPESNRVTDNDQYVVNELKEHKSWQNEYIMQNRDRYEDNNFVFINTGIYPGHAISPQYVYNHLIMILRDMNHPDDLKSALI